MQRVIPVDAAIRLDQLSLIHDEDWDDVAILLALIEKNRSYLQDNGDTRFFPLKDRQEAVQMLSTEDSKGICNYGIWEQTELVGVMSLFQISNDYGITYSIDYWIGEEFEDNSTRHDHVAKKSVLALSKALFEDARTARILIKVPKSRTGKIEVFGDADFALEYHLKGRAFLFKNNPNHNAVIA